MNAVPFHVAFAFLYQVLFSAYRCRAGAHDSRPGCQPHGHQRVVWEPDAPGKIQQSQKEASAGAAGQGEALDGRPTDAADRAPIPVGRCVLSQLSSRSDRIDYFIT